VGVVVRPLDVGGRLGAEERELATTAAPLVGSGAGVPRGFFLRAWAPGETSGSALTTMGGRLPVPGGSASDSGGESEPSVTSVGSVTAAANADPVTAAVARMARPLLISSPTFADSLVHGIGGSCGHPKL
jgi:hypothetical protein